MEVTATMEADGNDGGNGNDGGPTDWGQNGNGPGTNHKSVNQVDTRTPGCFEGPWTTGLLIAS